MPTSLKQQALRALGHQLWLPGRDRLLRLFANPDSHKPTPFEVDFFGVPYVGDLSNFIDWSVFFSGAYTVHELTLLRDIAVALRAQGKPVNFFDVGANIGHHTLFMAKYADRIISCEPFHVVRDKMNQKLQRAGIDIVTVLPFALGDSDQIGTYYPPTGCNEGTGTLTSNLPANASAEPICVEVRRGDDLFTAHQLPPISLLKMDVEGYELNVLRGLRQTLRRDRPPILVEINRASLLARGKAMRAELDELLYPDHLLFNVASTRSGRYLLRPFAEVNSDEALVLPAELAGILPGTA